MPNYDGANLALAQAKLMGKFKSESLKYRYPATFLKIKELTEIMMPSHKELRTREDRTVEAYTFSRTARTLGTARSHNHTGSKGDSLTLTPSWSTKADPFAISLKQGDNNVFSYQEQFENEIENCVRNFAEGLEQDAIDFIFNNRSTVGVASTVATRDATDDLYTIAEADVDRAVQIAKTVMAENNLKGQVVFFCDSLAYNKFEFNANQGTGNSTNLSFQYSGVEFVHSIDLDFSSLAGTYTKGNFIVAVVDSLASLDWIPLQNRQGVSTKEQSYGTLINPIDGMTYAIHEYAERSDDSATNGYTQDETRQYELSIDIALETAPLSTSGETCLQAFAIV